VKGCASIRMFLHAIMPAAAHEPLSLDVRMDAILLILIYSVRLPPSLGIADNSTTASASTGSCTHLALSTSTSEQQTATTEGTCYRSEGSVDDFACLGVDFLGDELSTHHHLDTHFHSGLLIERLIIQLPGCCCSFYGGRVALLTNTVWK